MLEGERTEPAHIWDPAVEPRGLFWPGRDVLRWRQPLLAQQRSRWIDRRWWTRTVGVFNEDGRWRTNKQCWAAKVATLWLCSAATCTLHGDRRRGAALYISWWTSSSCAEHIVHFFHRLSCRKNEDMEVSLTPDCTQGNCSDSLIHSATM